MINTAIIEEKDVTISKTLNLKRFDYLNEITDAQIDSSIHNFFTNNPDIDRIVIPIKLGDNDIDYVGILFGLHIRLAERLGNKRFIPIIFFSNELKEEIIANQIQNSINLTASLLFTKSIKIGFRV